VVTLQAFIIKTTKISETNHSIRITLYKLHLKEFYSIGILGKNIFKAKPESKSPPPHHSFYMTGEKQRQIKHMAYLHGK